MRVLATPRLLLLPLTRPFLACRLARDDFRLAVPTLSESIDVHVGPEWPGDPLPAFPAWLAGLTGDDDAVADTYVVVVRDGGEAVGLVGAKGPPDDKGEQEIGYGMNPGSWGQGYATEAVGLLIATLLEDVETVTAHTAVGNGASQRVLEKLGFSRTGGAWNEEDGDLFSWSRTR
jgi:RimJ/RimL family protein N-acetyltransferase